MRPPITLDGPQASKQAARVSFHAGLVLGTVQGMILGAIVMAWVGLPKPPECVQPQPGYLLRKVNLTLTDKRPPGAREGWGPSWREPRATFTCTEDRAP